MIEAPDGPENDAEAPTATPDMEALQRDWMAVIERHESKRRSWLKRGERIVKLYADADEAPQNSVKRKYSVLWANVQTLGPATYARAPKCQVSRRFQTPSQDVRNAVLALERATNQEIENSHLHDAIMSARLDRLLPGRGTIWIRYEAEDDGESVKSQKVCSDFVGYEDFGHGEARTWNEVDCVWRRVFMGQAELKEHFGEDVMERCGVSLDFAEKDATDAEKQATVYEIWCKSKKMVYWLAKNATKALDAGPPPLDLKEFWPCPKPLFATLTNKHCIPTPDYVYYQDQAEEITRLTKRIDKLTDALKLVGFYPAGPTTEGRAEIERAMSPGFENKLIPVPSWAAFSEKGGVGQIQYLPIDQVIKVIQACVELRKQLLSDVYQITGLSDIMRGDSNPNETLGAQQLKSQYGSNRMRDTKDDFIRFAREACLIIAEIIAEHFTPETLGRMTSIPTVQIDQATGQPSIDPLTGQPVIAPWVQLLRNQFARDVLIDVETDSTVQPDEDAEKMRRTEFMQAFGQAMTPLMSLQTMDPTIAKAVLPLFGSLLKFTAGGFRAGRELEEQIEETLGQLDQIAGQNAQMAEQQKANPQPPPEMAKIEADKATKIAEAQAKAQADAAKAKADAETEQHKTTIAALQEEKAAARQHELKQMTFNYQHAQLQQADRHHKDKITQADNAALREQQAAEKAAAEAEMGGEGSEEMLKQEAAAVAEAITPSLEKLHDRLDEIGAALVKLSGPKRLVRDPVTGEKRAEYVN